MRIRILFFVLFSFFLNSCSAPYFLYLQNNTSESIEIHVELNTNKYRKILEKRKLYQYKRTINGDVFPSDSTRIYLKNNIFSSENYQFTSDTDYHFMLKSNLFSNIEPNNGITIYPFKSIYYIMGDKKCYLIPKKNECNYRITKHSKLTELFEIEK